MPRHGAPAACALSPLNDVLDRHQAVLVDGRAVRDAEVGRYVAEQHHVDVLEHARADVVSFGSDQFLRDAGPQADGALEVLALHHLLHRQRRQDIQRHAGIMALAMAGRAFDQIGSWYPTPGFCEACGMSSISEPSEITGLPSPQLATQAVGMPA